MNNQFPLLRYQPLQIGDDKIRYALIQEGIKNLNVIGLNPSKANENNSDPTMKKVLGFICFNGYSGYRMFNLCPIRATNPDNLPLDLDREIYEKNLKEILDSICSSNKHIDILFSFGNNITKRQYMLDCFEDIIYAIKDTPCKCYQIGTLTKKGFPRHPLYEPYSIFNNFKIDVFLNGYQDANKTKIKYIKENVNSDVPKQVLEIAERIGTNIRHVRNKKGYEIFNVFTPNKTKPPTPTGIPTIIIFKNDEATIISGSDVFKWI